MLAVPFSIMWFLILGVGDYNDTRFILVDLVTNLFNFFFVNLCYTKLTEHFEKLKNFSQTSEIQVSHISAVCNNLRVFKNYLLVAFFFGYLLIPYFRNEAFLFVNFEPVTSFFLFDTPLLLFFVDKYMFGRVSLILQHFLSCRQDGSSSLRQDKTHKDFKSSLIEEGTRDGKNSFEEYGTFNK
eukprot:snap_masked-scaffold_6-processed-gene-2.6-mRNA-1 protein AED:1.00 eAED:1.00 QI:0/0/0/0/1/1/2/0/182